MAAAVLVTTSAFALTQQVPFGPGEQATYEVSFLGVPSGIAQITVGLRTDQYGARVLPLVCVGQSTSVASVFQIKDRFVSYFDPAQKKSVGVDYFIDENRARRKEQFRFNQEPQKVFAHKKKEGQGPYDVTYDVPDGTMDLAAAAFWLRSHDIVVGAVHEMPIFTGAKWYPMKATIEAKETITTKLGETSAYRVSISTDFQGNAATKGNILVWYTADEKKLPVRVRADFVVGNATADIVQYMPGSTLL
ncbi:MAG: DUF3108 domain-containing protein [Archangiaceae bacterium]|nr:DUF3108 domain-containing protein [Archangiaceae bacterium]